LKDLLNDIGSRVAAETSEAYFVGGCVRDLLRSEPLKDIDIALIGDTHAIGRMLARELRGHVFWLHQEEGVVRVALPKHEGLQIDLCPLRGSLDDDLRARDLTINAMAMAVEHGLDAAAPVLDPMGGQADLAGKRVRFCTPASPEADPLRTMRALRFRWKLGFELAEGTADRIRECVPLLSRVSVERIRDELFQFLSIENADEALAECLSFGTGRWLLGPAFSTVPSEVWPLAAEQVGWLSRFLRQAPDELTRLMMTEPTPPRRRREVLLWAAVVQSLGCAIKPGAAARYLALSNDERQLLVKGIDGALPATHLIRGWPAPGRVRYQHFRAAGPAGPETVLLSAVAMSEWTSAHAELLEEALDRTLRPAAPLLTGSDVMRLLGLPPGPRVGELMNGMEEARADGVLRTAEDATDWLRGQAH
jgi:hypothetical protein